MAERIFFIYSITNIKNGKRYIGSTVSTTDKWKKHRWELNKGIHANPHLQKSWKKYGKETFLFEKIDTSFGTKEDKQKLEDFYIDKFESKNENFGYNINSANLTANVMSDEQKMKISKATKGVPKNYKKIVQYDVVSGKFIKEWNTMFDIKQFFGQAGYLQCCKRNPSFKSVKGFGWAFKDEYFSKTEDDWSIPGYKPHFKTTTNRRPIFGTNLKTGETLYFPTITEGARHFDCSSGFLQRAVQFQGTRGRKSYKGHSWKYADVEN
jgi:group I intron endonuclease